MESRHVALIRGINLGRAKRVVMQDLRAAFESAGCRDVRTVLNSGNVVFTAPGQPPAPEDLQRAMERRIGVSGRVILLTARQWRTAVSGNPLLESADNLSRLQACFLASGGDAARLRPLMKQDWTPERLALGPRVAYLWCPSGLLESRLTQEVARRAGDAVTMRTWGTVLKIDAVL